MRRWQDWFSCWCIVFIFLAIIYCAIKYQEQIKQINPDRKAGFVRSK